MENGPEMVIFHGYVVGFNIINKLSKIPFSVGQPSIPGRFDHGGNSCVAFAISAWWFGTMQFIFPHQIGDDDPI